MTIASDARYRSVQLSFNNNDATGGEILQLFAKPTGGAWSLARTFPVGTDEQVTTWEGALPVTDYALAIRYLNAQVPAVGYESQDPDAWTAATAAQSKGTVETSSAAVAWVDGVFLGAAQPVTLRWASAQLGVPYLLEKDAGAGFVTVAADYVGTSYAYTVPPGELDTTVTFRLTARRGAVVGPTAGTLDVLMTVVVGQPVITTHTFSEATAKVSLAWSAATAALQYVVEKNAGAGWVTVGTVAGLSLDYAILPAEANHDVDFRVTGQNGAVSGTPSAAVTVACTMTIGVGSVDALSELPCSLSGLPQRLTGTNTPPSGAVVSNQVECSVDGAVVETVTIGAVATTFNTSCFSGSNLVGHTGSARIRGVGSGGVFGLWSAPYTVVL